MQVRYRRLIAPYLLVRTLTCEAAIAVHEQERLWWR